jgi:hypothetical protein
MVRPGNRNLADLERLAQRIEHLRLEFGQLVEEEHAVMRERDFAGPRAQSAADQPPACWRNDAARGTAGDR